MWRPLAGVIEERWRARFDVVDIHTLRTSLQAVVGQLDVEPPQYLPVVYPTQNGKADIPRRREPASSAAYVGGMPSLDLSELLSQVLLAFAIYFEPMRRYRSRSAPTPCGCCIRMEFASGTFRA